MLTRLVLYTSGYERLVESLREIAVLDIYR